MTNLELQKTANEVGKDIVLPFTAQSPDTRADLCQQQTCLHICILKR